VAPRTLVSRIDRVLICASPKASCRSVADFAWEVSQVKQVRSPIAAQLIVFRNPLRRLVSAYLNKYIEHSKYREASLQLYPQAQLDTFADFVEELEQHGFRCIDKNHFRPQINRYRWRRFDMIFNSEELGPLQDFVNQLFGTRIAMPFRVRAGHPGTVRDQRGSLPADASPLGTPLWLRPAAQLRALLEAGQAPGYGEFFNEELFRKARRVYAPDLRFLDRALNRGILGPDLHAQLTIL
jgi:hypothetical protein